MYAVGVDAGRIRGAFAPFDRLRAGGGSQEMPIFFVRSGGEAIGTNEMNGSCHPAGGPNKAVTVATA
jgi:hypothetical protein